MNRDEFWKIVEAARRSDGDAPHAKRLVDRLRSLSAPDIISFDAHFLRLRENAYRPDVWAAGLLLNHGHGTDDGFEYFRNWLISRGRKVYERTLVEPDTLSRQRIRVGKVGKVGPEAEFERFGYAAADAYEKVTGKRLDGSADRRKRGTPTRRRQFDWRRYTRTTL